MTYLISRAQFLVNLIFLALGKPLLETYGGWGALRRQRSLRRF